MPEKPSQELVVALAGPAVNVVLAAALYLGLHLNRDILEVSAAARVGGDFLSQLFWINVALAVFNLLPAFPMDGGRVVRALLAMRMDYVRATQIAARLGQGMAVLFVVFGLFGNTMLIFVALFVWIGAAQEAGMVRMRSALARISVQQAMITDFRALQPDEPISRAAEYAVAGLQQDFPVIDGGALVGMLPRKELSVAMMRRDPLLPVGDIMETDFVTISPRETLYAAFNGLQEFNCRAFPVVDDGRLVGLLTSDIVAEALMQASSHQPASSPGHRTVGSKSLPLGSTPRRSAADV
jgi:CBS domain-containing protein